VADCLASLGLIAFRQGQALAAIPLYEESLQFFIALGDRRSVAALLEEFAAVLASPEEIGRMRLRGREARDRAARLYAAATSLRAELGAPRQAGSHPRKPSCWPACAACWGTLPTNAPGRRLF
jgi:hypothetical protein